MTQRPRAIPSVPQTKSPQNSMRPRHLWNRQRLAPHEHRDSIRRPENHPRKNRGRRDSQQNARHRIAYLPRDRMQKHRQNCHAQRKQRRRSHPHRRRDHTSARCWQKWGFSQSFISTLGDYRCSRNHRKASKKNQGLQAPAPSIPTPLPLAPQNIAAIFPPDSPPNPDPAASTAPRPPSDLSPAAQPHSTTRSRSPCRILRARAHSDRKVPPTVPVPLLRSTYSPSLQDSIWQRSLAATTIGFDSAKDSNKASINCS